MPEEKAATRKGYIISTWDTVGRNVDSTGHIFGKLGQGTKSYPAAAVTSDYKPFYWGPVVSTNSPGMLISLFPEASIDGGLDANTKFIKFLGSQRPWVDIASFDVPTRPDAVESPDPPAAATALKASLIATMLVASSLM